MIAMSASMADTMPNTMEHMIWGSIDSSCGRNYNRMDYVYELLKLEGAGKYNVIYCR